MRKECLGIAEVALQDIHWVKIGPKNQLIKLRDGLKRSNQKSKAQTDEHADSQS